MFQRFTIALLQVTAGNTSENVLIEVFQIIYFVYQVKKMTKNDYIWQYKEFNKGIIQNRYHIY